METATPFPDSWSDEFLDAMRMETDPVADEVVARLVADKGPGEARRLFKELITNLDVPLKSFPAYVRAYFETHQFAPEWTNWEQVRRGEEVFLDYGPQFLVFLYYRSLPTLYACWRGAQVLVMTGRLTHDSESMEIFSRRVAETGQFLIDVMSPDSLISGRGIQAALKVRLIHASIRRFIPADRWNEAEWGKPINQEDLAMTLMTFSISLLDAMELVGVELSADESEAYLHNWQVIGDSLGIRKDLIPRSVEEGRALLRKIMSRQQGSSEAGTMLTKALIAFAENTLPTRLFDNAPEILIRYLSGDELADTLQVKPTWGCLTFALPRIMRKSIGWIERLEDFSEPIDKLMDRVAAALVEKMVDFFNTYKDNRIQVPSTLRKAWGLQGESDAGE